MFKKNISFVKKISLACIAIILMAIIYYMNRDIFMSVDRMLATGYVFDPDYYGEIRGDLCGSCDDGVIQFKDSLKLIDIMYDDKKEKDVKDRAGWTFMYLQKHMLAQFSKYKSEHDTKFALKVLQHFLSKKPDKYALSRVYLALHKDKEETFNQWDTKKKKLQDARSLFNSFCTDIWGERLRVKKQTNGKPALISATLQMPIQTQNDWLLHKHMISRYKHENIYNWSFQKYEVIPISCFENKEEIYDLLDYEKSARRAVHSGQKDVLSDLIRRKPAILNYIRENQSNYLIGQFQFPYQKETVSWLIKALNNK